MPRCRLAALATKVALGTTAVALLAPHSPAGLQALAAGAGPWAFFALLGAWVLLTPMLFPGTVLAVAGGLLLGAGPGIVVSLAGATAGAAAAFLVARLARGDDAPRAPGRMGALQERLEAHGFATVAAARIAPGAAPAVA